MNQLASHKTKISALTLAALGVVFGDIGTSPLYTLQTIFSTDSHSVPLTQANIFGILSLIFWTLIMVTSVKYIAFIMQADNRGEGGIMSLLALTKQYTTGNEKKQLLISFLGILGACMFFADGMITPAISVLSAVEGLELAAPILTPLVVPISLGVLLALFLAQYKGTNLVGVFFGPIMLLWFGTLGVLGIHGILHNSAILSALNPIYAILFFAIAPWLAFMALGGVVLCVTGAEALYADMGHFGGFPIRLAWYGLVLPTLILNYFGQGALILSNPATAKNPFYLLAPEWMLYPLIILATISTVIASQAVITGAFSISRQALQLGYLPRMHVEHTSESQEGQIYMPRINWGLMLAVMALVIGFGSSAKLGAAYGIAVTGNMIATSLLAGIVFHNIWGWGKLRTGALVALFLTVDGAFFSANLLKIPDGGWVPLVIGILIFTLMNTWKTGRSLLFQRLKSEAMALAPFIEAVGAHPPERVPGTAIFLTPNIDGVPPALLHNLKHNKVLHEKVVILTVRFLDIPHAAAEERVYVEVLPHNFYKVIVRFGFKDETNLPRILELYADKNLKLDLMDTSFFLGKEILIAGKKTGMALWRKKIFIGLFRSAETITNQFHLPANRVVELGSQLLF
jgi:KUP system potassium uptake protein